MERDMSCNQMRQLSYIHTNAGVRLKSPRIPPVNTTVVNSKACEEMVNKESESESESEFQDVILLNFRVWSCRISVCGPVEVQGAVLSNFRLAAEVLL